MGKQLKKRRERRSFNARGKNHYIIMMLHLPELPERKLWYFSITAHGKD
jgi:hypothetical protein